MSFAGAQPDPSARLAQVRRSCRTARREIQGADRSAAEARIGAALLQIVGESGVDRVAVYNHDDGEVDLSAVMKRLDGLGVGLLLPILRPADPVQSADPASSLFGATDAMSFAPWGFGQALVAGRFGLLEPVEAASVAPAAVPLVLVPLVAFGAAGHRTGRGAGFYDRAFGPSRGAPERPVLIGVGFECQRVSDLPRAAHDVPMDALVSELGVRWTSGARSAASDSTADRNT